ncbi:MAG: polyprenol monophosphomannose synthase [Candidatus Dojkabacteria bacterium]|nr:polyprenol monophosphomannose synthase [Candidatus Dojkabacteria bacterium]
MKKLAIAIPTYNEKDNLEDIVKAIKKVLEKVQIETTVIIIDDNSPDGTGKIADRLTSEFNTPPFQVTVIHREGKLGLASAYKTAFKQAIDKEFDYILSMDADFSHKPEYIPDFLTKIKEYDMVIGSRNIKGGGVENWSLFRQFISKGGSLYSRTILGVKIKDFTAGYVMYKRDVLLKIGLDEIRSEGYSYAIEMKHRVAKMGFSFCEIPIIFPDRVKGKAKMSRKIFLEAFLRVWQLRFTKISK